ncbi:hypothetical protein LQZ19_16565 [Treponema primitia]|uniref:hypothetical protein n=1 Tax=Treponema primitia TaxID=88058 RepID=UPI00398088F9
MKKYIVVLLIILVGTFSLPAQNYGEDEFNYDWDSVIEEPPDFVDPYAPVTPATKQAAPATPTPVTPAAKQAAPTPAPVTPVPTAAPAQDYGEDELNYDWDSVIEEPPDFVDPYARETPLQNARETPLQNAPATPVLAEPLGPPEPQTLEPVLVQGKNYRVFSDGDKADAELLLKEMELRMDLYNRLFRFDLSAVNGPLQVRSISDGEAYKNYVQPRLDETTGFPSGAVYFHYIREDMRELVIHRGSAEEAAMVSHQAFIQYLRAFIANPPSWMRDGFAIVFSTLHFDVSSQELVYDENLSWLNTVKGLGSNAAEPEAILLADTEEYSGEPIENFKPLAWSLASFFLNYNNEDYFRTLTEMFLFLSPNVSAERNAQAAVKRLTLRTDFETLTADYHTYLASRRTFAELIDAGQRAYTAGDRASAGESFTQALSVRPDHTAPYYYLGLLAYNEKNFAKAEELYNTALKHSAANNADSALIQYALGLNAVSAGRNAEGRRWLEQAAAAAPDRYGEKTAKVLERLKP